MSNHEYNNHMTGKSCQYSTLANYTASYSMNVAPQGKVTSGVYIVPTWSPIGYEDLTGNGVSSCAGYPGINDAYQGAGSCQTTYRASYCSGGVKPLPVGPAHHSKPRHLPARHK